MKYSKPLNFTLTVSKRIKIYFLAVVLNALSVPIIHSYIDVNLTIGELFLHSLDIALRSIMLMGLFEVVISGVLRNLVWQITLRQYALMALIATGFILFTIAVVFAPSLLDLNSLIHKKHLAAGYADMPLRVIPVGLIIAFLLYHFLRSDFLLTRLENLQEINRQLTNLQSAAEASDFPLFIIRQDREEVEIDSRKIIRLEADENYCHIHMDAHPNRYFTRTTLSDALQRLPNAYFVQTHRSHIVNLLYADKIQRYEQQRVLLLNKDGQRIPISRGRFKEVKARLTTGRPS